MPPPTPTTPPSRDLGGSSGSGSGKRRALGPGARKENLRRRAYRRPPKHSPRRYAELHAISAFSFLDGSSPPEDLVEQAAKLGLPAIALTDRGGVYGAPRLHKAAKEAGLRALVGAEVALIDDQSRGAGPRSRITRREASQGRGAISTRSQRWKPGSLLIWVRLMQRSFRSSCAYYGLIAKNFRASPVPLVYNGDLAGSAPRLLESNECSRLEVSDERERCIPIRQAPRPEPAQEVRWSRLERAI